MSTTQANRTGTIDVAALHERVNSGRPVELIDVRTPAEFASVHVPFARSVPLDRLDPRAVMSDRAHPDEPLYVICRSGARGQQACAALAAAGHGDKAVNVAGGTLAWEAAGLPVERGARRVWSLDRQVRAAIGALVLAGVGLGAFVHPAFLGLAAFCGAGLIFAGVTDTCGMALLIARMPWNQAGNDSTGATCAR